VNWIKQFYEDELQMLLSGIDDEIDVEDLKKFTVYKGFPPISNTINIFWHVFKQFSNEERMMLIKFVTSCHRPPLLGFKYLNPKFTIQRIEGIEKLPSSSTCFNILKLPDYQNEKVMREKLMKSITLGKGFYKT